MVSFNVKINEKMHEIKDVDSSLFIGEVKLMVENISGVPKDCQKWIYKGRILNDSMSLSESSIVDGNTVIVMRTAQPSPPVPTAATAATSTGNSAYPINDTNFNQVSTRLTPSIAKFDNAMFELLQNSDESVVQAAVSVLLKVISNIISQPSIEKYRKLSRTNAAFTKKVGNVGGGSQCMIALGFQLVGDDWVLVPSAEAWENITLCKAKLEKFSLKLSAQMLSSSGNIVQTVSAESTTLSSTPVSQDPQTAGSLSPQAMQQFLQSLAVMQTSIPLQSNMLQDTAAISADEQDGGENDEEEEIIPQL